MAEVHFGVVRIDGRWQIIGQGLRTGSYPTQFEAEQAARRLADSSVPHVQLHIQDEMGVLRPPVHLD